jgi:hypothetical protein
LKKEPDSQLWLHPVFSAVWEEIEDLIRKGRFITIDFVEEEINNYEGKEEFVKKWVLKWKKQLVVPTDEECLNAAIPIINDEYSTEFFDAKKQAEGKRIKNEEKEVRIRNTTTHNTLSRRNLAKMAKFFQDIEDKKF